MKPSVALVGGQWAQNIGNAFFNLGGKFVLEKVFGDEAVGFIQDHPGYRSLHNKLKGNPSNYLNPVALVDAEYVVLQGPVLNSWMDINWRSTFEALRRRNVKVLLLSCAFFKFTRQEIDAVKRFLYEFPPALIATRDPRSFEIIKNWLPHVPKYSGIDSGFFVADAVNPLGISGDPYVVFNFDRYPEPTLIPSDVGQKITPSRLQLAGKDYDTYEPSFQRWAAHRSKVWSYIGASLDRRRLPDHIGDLKVVRTEHRFFPHITGKIYKSPNSTASDEPWTYLSLYSGAELTLSDRIHACVATLAFGNPAMLFTPSPRSSLFEAVGAGDIREKLVTLDMNSLAEKKAALISWLKGSVRDVY